LSRTDKVSSQLVLTKAAQEALEIRGSKWSGQGTIQIAEQNMPGFPEGSEWSQIKAEYNYFFTRSRKVTLNKNKTKNICNKAVRAEKLLFLL